MEYRKSLLKLRETLYKFLINEYSFYILLTITLILLLNPNHLHHGIPDMDEIWNYQYARRILYGQIPYKDFAMLQTPFSMQINAQILKIFGDNLITMRWAASIFAAFNAVIVYRIVIIRKKNHVMSIIYTFFFLTPFLFYPKNNYSWYAIFFLSIALLLEIDIIYTNKLKRTPCELYIGIALGLTFITKQNIGFTGTLVSILFSLYSNKGSNKDLFRKLALKIIGFSLVVVAEVLYLSLNMNIIAMVNEMVNNLFSFAEQSAISYGNLFENDRIFMILAFVIPSLIIITFVKGLVSRDNNTRLILVLGSFYAVANLTMLIPISDPIHLIFGMPIPILAASLLTGKPNASGQKEQRYIAALFVFIIIFSDIYGTNIRCDQLKNTINHYENVYIPSELKNRITVLDKLIVDEEAKGNTVYFLNYQAAFYLIPLDKFNYRYDTVGSNTYAETEIINKLETNERIIVIIRSNDVAANWQESTKIQEYVRSRMIYQGNIYDFEIYEK